jgi:glycosyltransferase involved in cell wall biosynthesis
MRIAHVTATFPPYMAGTGNVCYYNTLELARRGHQVSVYTAAGPTPGSFDPPGVTVHRLPAVLRFGNAPLLPGLMQIKGVDIIHLHYPFIFGAEIVWAVSKLRHIPFVVTYHNDLIGQGSRRLLFNAYSALTAGMVLGAARKLGVVSMDHARTCRMARMFIRRWNDVVEIPNGVDTDLFRPLPGDPAVRRKFGIPQEAPLILFVGALDRAHYFKGVSFLLDVIAKINRKNIYLLIVGDGEWKARYQSHAEELGISQEVVFAGSIPFPELPQYYGCADVLALPSELESFGMVLIEAMACEKPVIATDLPGIRTVVTDGVEGWLVPPSDMDKWVEKIRSLLDDPQGRMDMGIHGRAKVENQFAWRRILPRLIRLYEEALVSRTAPNGRRDF